MEIRRSTRNDLAAMNEIYAFARRFMAAHGNPNQWGPTGWPPEALLRQDIAAGNSYVCVEDGRVVGTFFFRQGADAEPTYRDITDGSWLDESPYGVLHRVASDGTVKGVGRFCMDWAYARCGHLRADTHGDNLVMQSLLQKCGFVRCGIVHVAEDSYPRLAYEKVREHKTILRCPVCGGALDFRGKAMRCPAGHAFDLAREGYVNLLRSTRSGDRMGDSKESARSRRDFLSKGYYRPLRDALCGIFAGQRGTVLDICCGEGYYTAALGENPALRVYGFDLSKEMIRLAARRGGATYFVANLAAIPVADGSVDAATQIFAPFHEPEFARVLRSGGRLYSVTPGSRHLWALKERLYDAPYPNDEALPAVKLLRCVGRRKISAVITLESPEDIETVFRMTPYYYHTSQRDRDKLNALASLRTEIEFIIAEYEKP